MPFLILGAYYILAVIAALHVLRNKRELYWLFILFAFPLLGGAVYFVTQILPELAGGRHGRQARRAIAQAVDPERDYRIARAALDDTPSAGNQLRLGHAAFALNRFEEAAQAYRAALTGQFHDDPVGLLGLARTLLELNQPQEALATLETLRGLGREGETAEVAMHTGRALEALGRLEEAEAPYRFAADRLPGLEAGARYVAFIARAGRHEEAAIGLEELNRRLAKTPPAFRSEARRWRDHAAAAIGRG